MSKIGPKETALKALSKAHQMMVADGLPTALVRTGGKPHEQLVGKKDKRHDGVTLAPPVAVQKAIEKDLAEVIDIPAIPKEKPQPKKAAGKASTKAGAKPEADQQEDSAMRTSKRKKTATAKARKSIKATATKADGPRPGSKAELIGRLLQRKEGCTTADVLKATGWPAVSMPAQAKAAGLKLRKEKAGKVTRYYAA